MNEESLLEKAGRIVNDILTSCEYDIAKLNAKVSVLKEDIVREATVGTEKIQDGQENLDGWLPLSLNQFRTYDFNLMQLRQVRESSRVACSTNEIPQNIIKHYKNHIIGAGLIYMLLPHGFGQNPEDIAADNIDNPVATRLMKNWNKFQRVNELDKRLPNIIERSLRDGECGIRFFRNGKDVPKIRFVEANFMLPGVSGSNNADPNYNGGYFGVTTNPKDIEDIKSYAFNPYSTVATTSDAKEIPADEMVFIKRNVDFESPRGIPDFWPVLSNIRRVEKLHVNVSVLAQIQSAIAFIRKHENQTGARVDALVNRQATGRSIDPETKQVVTQRKLRAGTILDAPLGTTYDFPAHNIESKNFIEIINAELARIAARFVLPVDWLLSKEPTDPLSPGSPTVANFKSEQSFFYLHIIDMFWKVQEYCGEDVESLQDQFDFVITGPHLAVGKALDQARVQQILLQSGATSPQEVASVFGNNWAVSRANMLMHIKTLTPGESTPGSLGNTQVGSNDGVSKKDGGTRQDGASGGDASQ